MNVAVEARRLLRRQHRAALATISRQHAGYPFGSLVRYLLDAAARPLLLVSRLAEHTRNIDADARVSLLASEVRPDGDVQAEARVTVLGHCARVADPEPERARYLRYFPDAEGLLALGDFGFYRIEVSGLRFIAGFGRIDWVSSADYAPPQTALAQHEADILAHMNADHAPSLRDYCRHGHGRDAREVEMVGIDCDGFDVRADGALLRFEFAQPVLDPQGARAALIALARDSRG